MKDDLISVIDVARELGKRKQTVFKILKRLRIEQVKARGGDSRGQLVSHITQSDYERVRAELTCSPGDSGVVDELSQIGGVFYVIQLEPKHDPGRIKVGFATSMDDRLRSHRTAAPMCKLVKTWPCKALWEKTAIDSICDGYERIHTEVFRAPSCDDVVARCDLFFSVMPRIKRE
jgi:hypothetical protein